MCTFRIPARDGFQANLRGGAEVVGTPLRRSALVLELTELYRTSTTKARRTRRARRTREQIAELKAALVDIVEAENPMTVRGVFYSAETAGLIGKTEVNYKNVICRLVLQLRREGTIPYHWITDGTRWQIKDRSFSGPEAFRAEMVDFYRRALWDDQDVYVEVFTEKDAIAGILSPITGRWDVPLNVVRGFSSETFLWSVAQTIIAVDKPTYLYYFGDWDSSGVVGATDVERRLRGFAHDAEIHFERVAVTPEQIQKWKLPTRPTKTSTHSTGFKGDSVEVDAIKAPRLRALVTESIERHIDLDRHRRTEAVEKAERDSLTNVLELWRTSA
jgi:hypothetical protein